MLKHRTAILIALTVSAAVFPGCRDDAPSHSTAPPPANDEVEDKTKKETPGFLLWTDEEGARVIARAAAMPDVRTEVALSSTMYRLDMEQSFVVTGSDNGSFAEVTFLAMPSVDAPHSEWKFIVHVEAGAGRYAGSLIVSQTPRPDAWFMDGNVWVTAHEFSSSDPGADRFTPDQWNDFIFCVIERSALTLTSCSFVCIWAIGGWTPCLISCVTANEVANVIGCATGVFTATHRYLRHRKAETR